MDLSPTHVHLLLNHFPTIGFIIGFVLFVAGLIARSDHIKQAALAVGSSASGSSGRGSTRFLRWSCRNRSIARDRAWFMIQPRTVPLLAS